MQEGTGRNQRPANFCLYCVTGVIVVTGDDGSQCSFRSGDAFVSPAGFTGTWEIAEPAKKLYAYDGLVLISSPEGGEGRRPKLVNLRGPGPYRLFCSQEDQARRHAASASDVCVCLTVP